MTVIGVPVDPLVAVREFLRAELASRGDTQHVGVDAPEGIPERYILLGSGDDDSPTRFLGEHVIPIVLYDKDAVRLGLTTHLVIALFRSVSNTLVETEQGRTYLLAVEKHFGPGKYEDPDVPLFGRRLGVGVLMANTVL